MRVDWDGGAIAHPLLDDWGVSATFDGRTLVVRGGPFKRARLFRGQDVIADTDRLGLRSTGDERTFEIDPPVDAPCAVEIVIATGYRN